jgi:hypothetical protein
MMEGMGVCCLSARCLVAATSDLYHIPFVWVFPLVKLLYSIRYYLRR